MRKIPFIEQMEHSECGLACLSMIFSYYGHQVSLLELREEFGVPKGGFTFANLADIAKRKNMEVIGYKATVEALKEIKNPLILFIDKKHFVVLEKVKKNVFYIVDPAIGRIKLTLADMKERFSGVVLSLLPSQNFIKRKGSRHFSFLLSFVIKQPKLLLLILGFSLLLQGLGIILPLLTKLITDNILSPKGEVYLNTLGISIIIMLICYIIFSFTRGLFIAKLQTAIDEKMMTHFLGHLLNLPYNYFENRSNGELLFRANSNVMIRQILSTKLISFIIDGILLFIYAYLMIKMSSFLGILVIGIGLSLFLLLIMCTGITHAITNKDVTNQSKVQQVLTESIHGISDIKVMGLENVFFNEWKKNFENQLNSSEKRSIWNNTLNIIPSAIQFAIPILILWIGSSQVIGHSISLGTLIAFNTLALSFITPISSIGLGYTEIISLKSYLQRIYDVINSKSEFTDKQNSKLLLKGEIELKNLCFSYDPYSENILNNINLKVKPGETLAIVGNSGSGKSTIAKLLLGLYKPSQGHILYDDVDINNLDLKYLRKQIGGVLQETQLFNKSIIENINLQNETVTDEQIILACQRADILNDILSNPLGFNTIVSETGMNFSGGQRQRISLARALLKNPKILILDEATSALDNISEFNIYESILSLDCTKIIIAHRLSTIKKADRIIVLDNGRIVEEGSHKELIDLEGHYFKLFNANQNNNTLASELLVHQYN
ncbi:peptidase domain-containing ABC transporter [Cytobacillus massiliigabonensis]|uniref:peptidase domain-containing ABC transporter n=1 Tax=Cytobacillus massiliigabonensis TaxID=1871011 RepID=UPI000C82B76A|nr:peptidase domain-containing ABC transporter [Cytobacillus massiliigabonensis]